MKNLMMYVEENLLRRIFSPEYNYGEEIAAPNNDNKSNSDQESNNVPLVSPQSTLGDKPLKPPPGLTLPAEPMNLYSIPEETATIIRPESNSTKNPFLHDEEYAQDKYTDIITPQKFMELWNHNLKLQMEITSVFNVILNKVVTGTRNGIVHKTSEIGRMENVQQQFNDALSYLSCSMNLSSNGVLDQNNQPFDTEHLGMSNNALLFSDKDVSIPTSYSASNISDAYAFTTPSVGKNYSDLAVSNDTIFSHNNVTIPKSFEAPSTPSNGPISTCVAENNYFVPNLTNSTKYNASDLNFTTDGYSNVNPMTNTLNTTTRSDFFENCTNQSIKDVNPSVITNVFGSSDTKGKSYYENEQISTNQNNYFRGSNNTDNNTFNFPGSSECQRTFANSTKNDSITSFEETKDTFTPVKETNPFKLILAGKLKISELPDESSERPGISPSPARKTWESVSDSDLSSSFKTIPRNDFEYHKMKIKNANNNNPNANRSMDILPIDVIPNYSTYGQLFSENVQTANNVEKNSNDISNRNNSMYACNVDTVTNALLKDKNKQNITEHESWDCFTIQGNANCTEGSSRSQERNHEAFSHTPSKLECDVYDTRNGQEQEQFFNAKHYFTFPQAPFSFTDYGGRSAENINIKQQSLNYNSNDVTSSSWTPFNSFPSPVVSDNLNIDEGYLTRPSTSHLLQSLSPLESDFPSLTENSNESVEGLLKSMGNIVSNQRSNAPQHSSSQTQPAGTIVGNCSPFVMHNSLYENSHLLNEAQQCNIFMKYRQEERQHTANHQLSDMQNLSVNDNLESQGNVKDLTEKLQLRTNEHESINVWKTVGSNDSTFLDQGIIASHSNESSTDKFFFKTIELPKRRMHIFHYEDEGWLLTDEFIEAFTEFQTASYFINILNAFGLRVSFKELERVECPLKFAKLERTLKKATRDAKDKIEKIHLLPLKSVLKVLGQLRIITRQDIDNAIMRKEFLHGSVTHDVWLLINGYAEFKSALRVTEQL